MNCPSCKTSGLNLIHLENELPASVCPGCGGTWISFTQYWSWLERQGPGLPERPISDPPLPVQDSKGAKLCPECGGILTRYKVGRECAFSIDHCGKCKGIWLDKNEWDVLKHRHLHDDLHLILDPSWQRQLRREESQRKLQAIYEQKFGTETYAEIKKIREWLARQPQRSALLAYLNNDDPYKE